MSVLMPNSPVISSSTRLTFSVLPVSFAFPSVFLVVPFTSLFVEGPAVDFASLSMICFRPSRSRFLELGSFCWGCVYGGIELFLARSVYASLWDSWLEFIWLFSSDLCCSRDEFIVGVYDCELRRVFKSSEGRKSLMMVCMCSSIRTKKFVHFCCFSRPDAGMMITLLTRFIISFLNGWSSRRFPSSSTSSSISSLVLYFRNIFIILSYVLASWSVGWAMIQFATLIELFYGVPSNSSYLTMECPVVLALGFTSSWSIISLRYVIRLVVLVFAKLTSLEVRSNAFGIRFLVTWEGLPLLMF
jgi:hypothetical protein